MTNARIWLCGICNRFKCVILGDEKAFDLSSLEMCHRHNPHWEITDITYNNWTVENQWIKDYPQGPGKREGIPNWKGRCDSPRRL